MKKILLALCGILFLFGCGAEQKETGLYVSERIQDFEISLTAQEDPLACQLEIAYTGEDASVQVWHGNPIEVICLLDAGGEPVLPVGRTDELCSSVFEPGKSYTVVWDGAREEQYFGPLESGEYIVMAWVSFALDEDFTNKVDCRLELPLTIE